VTPCWARPVRVTEPSGNNGTAVPAFQTAFLKECDICGSADLAEIKCKVICRNCRTILQSCADL
jgi:hypothetical protein